MSGSNKKSINLGNEVFTKDLIIKKKFFNNKEFNYIQEKLLEKDFLGKENKNLVIFGFNDITYVYGFELGSFQHWEGLDFKKISPLEIKEYFNNLQILKDIGLCVIKDGKIDSEVISTESINLEYNVNDNIEKEYFNILFDNVVICRGIILEY